MESGASWAGVATVAWASAVAVVSSVAIYRARARGRDDGSVPQGMRVLMIRPCAGNEPGLKNALRSVALVRSKTRPDIRMTVASPRDLAREPTLAAAQWLTERGFDARAVVAPPRGPNHKIGQLAEIADSSLSDYDAVVVVDSDVDLAGIDLDAMLSPIADADSRLAATWCAPVERNAASTLGDRASAAVLGGSLQAFVLLGKLDGDGLVGKTFAVRTDALREIGGFGALHRHLGEDMEMARRLRAQGWSTRMVDQPVPSLATGRTLRDVVGRYSRWLMGGPGPASPSPALLPVAARRHPAAVVDRVGARSGRPGTRVRGGIPHAHHPTGRGPCGRPTGAAPAIARSRVGRCPAGRPRSTGRLRPGPRPGAGALASTRPSPERGRVARRLNRGQRARTDRARG